MKEFVRKFLPKKIKPHRILRGMLSGDTIVTSWHDYPAGILGYTERPLLDWFGKNVISGETWLDVGAHYGFTAIAMSKLIGPLGRVFAFEPMLSTVGYLNQTRQANNFRQMMVLPFALSDETLITTARFPVTRGMVDSTIVDIEWEEMIYVTGLDWLWPQICGNNESIDGIKIDIQGMELQALRGMKKILKEQQPKLIVEFHNGVNRDDILSLLESVGYSQEATPIEPVEGEDQIRYLDNRSYAFSAT